MTITSSRPRNSLNLTRFDKSFLTIFDKPRRTKSGKAKLAILQVLICLFLCAGATAQDKPVRRILFINDVGRSSPEVALMDGEIQAALENTPYRIEFYSENLEPNLFPNEVSQRKIRDWYIDKYHDRKPDLIIAVGPTSINFLADSPKMFLPGTPIVFCGSAENLTDYHNLGSTFTGVWGVLRPEKTLDSALNLLPDTKHVIVVGGLAAFDRHLFALARENFKTYESRLDFTYLTDLPMSVLLERLRNLPDNTIIYLTTIMQASALANLVQATQAVSNIVSATNAPVFVSSDIDVEAGAIGGDFESFASQGRIAAGMAVRILNGERQGDIPMVRDADIYEFNSRALKRWGLDESRLPPGSIVINRQPSIWRAYKRFIIPGILLLLAQALIIIGLLWQRGRNKKIRADLVRSNERLRLVMQTGNTVGWELDLAAGVDFLFGDLNTVFGIPSDTFTGRAEDFYRYVHPEDLQRVKELVAEARQSGKPYIHEFRILWLDGQTTRWVVSRGKFEYSPNGKPTRMVGLAIDITERKKVEEALKASEEKFSKAFRESPMALTLTSAEDHRYIEVNDTFLKITGWTSDEVIGRTPFDIKIWADPTQRTEFVKRLLAEGYVRELEVAFLTKGGQQRTGLGAAELIHINGERCVLSVIADITDAKQAEENRQFSERRFRQFFETMPEYSYISSPSGEIVDANPAACRALGFSKEEILGKSLSSIYAPESYSKIIDLLEKLHRTGTLRNEEMFIVTRNGQKRSVLLNAGSVLDAQGNVVFSTSVQTDISDFKKVQKRLQENQVRLDAIIESAMDAIITVDQEQRVVLFNAAAEKMFRCPAKEAIGNSIDRFIPRRFHAAHKSHVREFGRTGITNRTMGTTSTFWALRTNNEEFPIEASISHVSVGGQDLFTVIIRDITGDRLAEEAKSLHSAIVESSSDAIIAMNLEGLIQSWNAAAEQMYGYPKEEAIGKLITIIVPNDQLQEEIGLLRRVHAGEHISNVETVRKSKDGKLIDVSMTVSPVRDLDGNIIGASKITRDISARKLIAEALRESEERFRLVANTAPVMIWLSDPDKLCTYFNQTWLDFTGQPLESELGNGWADGVYPDDLQRCLETYTKAFDHRERFQMEYRLRRHDGEYRWVFDQGVPRFNVDGSFVGYIGSCIDVTERKLAEEALSTVSRRLIEAHEEERTWLARELHDDINQRIALLAATLPHLKQALPASAVEASSKIDDLSDQATSLGFDVQALSHHLHSSKLEYLGLNTAAASFCREFSDQHGLEIDFRSDEIPKTLPKEISLCLFRVLQEALQNAMKHSGSKQIRVTLAANQGEIQLAVADSGHGFDAEAALRGRGVGLSNMKERLKLVHGHFSIAGQPKGGTVVSVRVPLKTSIGSAQATSI
jgi:PAS domain S-box-containing protein